MADLSKILRSPSYVKAFEDHGLLNRDETRHIRLQLEWLKADLIQQEQRILSTIVVFGSSRVPEPSEARRLRDEARRDAEEAPDDPDAARALRRAERVLDNSRYYHEARAFARLVSEMHQDDDRREFVVVTGGGPGIMEAANRGAHDAGAKSLGLNITLPHEQRPNPFVTPELCFQFQYFAIRKMHFLYRAKALVAFPGGFGTMDELFETLTLIQTGKTPAVPVVLFGRRFWDRVVDFGALLEEGVISPEDLEMFTYAETAREAWAAIARFYGMD